MSDPIEFEGALMRLQRYRLSKSACLRRYVILRVDLIVRDGGKVCGVEMDHTLNIWKSDNGASGKESGCNQGCDECCSPLHDDFLVVGTKS